MYLNGFSVRVTSHKGEQPGGYVLMQHGKHYRIVLHNHNNERCAAQVQVDGKDIGTFRINGNDSLTLERPAHDDGRFTFYKLGTPEAAQVGLDGSSSELGLVRVTFTPEKHQEPVQWITTGTYAVGSAGGWYDSPTYTSCHSLGEPTASLGGGARGMSAVSAPKAQNCAAGGTGLSGHSDQHFHTVANLDYDYTRQTVIHLRLVCDMCQDPRPLTSYSTPVPPRVG
jgi:hypothetical protein